MCLMLQKWIDEHKQSGKIKRILSGRSVDSKQWVSAPRLGAPYLKPCAKGGFFPTTVNVDRTIGAIQCIGESGVS